MKVINFNLLWREICESVVGGGGGGVRARVIARLHWLGQIGDNTSLT